MSKKKKKTDRRYEIINQFGFDYVDHVTASMFIENEIVNIESSARELLDLTTKYQSEYILICEKEENGIELSSYELYLKYAYEKCLEIFSLSMDELNALGEQLRDFQLKALTDLVSYDHLFYDVYGGDSPKGVDLQLTYGREPRSRKK